MTTAQATAQSNAPSALASSNPTATDQAQRQLLRAWSPSETETAVELTEIEGELPRELNGTLYRNGPSQRQMPPQGYEALHLFDGDGLVHALRLEDGKAHYTGRFVESESYLVEQAERRFCMSSVNLLAENPTDKVLLREQHNTNIVHHGGKLMAMVENAWPVRLDPKTLATIGKTDFGCDPLGMAVSAHPKIDGRTGQMIIHGYQPFEPFVQLYVVEADGNASLAEPLDVPYASMMHDIAATENYVIVLLCPVVIDGEALISGAKPFADAVSWQPERGMRFGVRRREAGAAIRWFDAPTPGFIFHPGNAFEKDGKIFMDACTYLDPRALLASLSGWRRGAFTDGWGANPFLYVLDLETGACTETKLDERYAEFPRLDDRRVCFENRYGYSLIGRATAGADSGWLDLVKYDRTGHGSEYFSFGEGHFAGEPVFVPRSEDAAEDDGFVLQVVFDAPSDRSYLSVIDARHVAAGPVAKAWLKHRVPLGFHGNFAPGVV